HLQNNGRTDIRHDAQRRHRTTIIGTTRKGVIQSHHSTGTMRLAQVRRHDASVNTRKTDKSEDLRNGQQTERKENPGFKLRNLEAVQTGVVKIAKHESKSRSGFGWSSSFFTADDFHRATFGFDFGFRRGAERTRTDLELFGQLTGA